MASNRTGKSTNSDSLLQHKNAVIYGGGGAIGAAVARAFARDGAHVFLAGRTLEKLQTVAEDIARDGGRAEAARVDALDEAAVEDHIRRVAGQADQIDILFDAVAMEDVQGTPMLDMSVEDFVHPVLMAVRTKFVIARAAARHMVQHGSGVIMTITVEPTPAENLGGFMPACSAVEGLWRSFACELGPRGVRLIVIRSAGSPDTPGVQEVTAVHAERQGLTPEQLDARYSAGTMLRRLPSAAEVANAATVLASDHASAMTAVHANVSCGAFFDL